MSNEEFGRDNTDFGRMQNTVAEYQPLALISKHGISESSSFLMTISPSCLKYSRDFPLVLDQQF